MQETVVGIYRPIRIDSICGHQFHAGIIYLTGVLIEHSGTIRIRKCHDQVLSVNVEDIHTVVQTTVQQRLRQGYFIVPHRFRFQIGILRRKHIHLAQNRVTETF